MDRLTSLTVFTRVVDAGGFSAAARRLNMSTTMVSNHVQALENRLGVRLLNRTTRKVSVTEIGREYHERCSQVLAELDEADQIAGALQLTPRGTLRLHCDTHIARFISPVIVDYLMANPELSIDLRLGERMPDLIEDGFDLAIRATPAPDSTLVVRQLTRWRSYLCASPDYLETHAAPKNLADLAQHNCLRYAYHPFGDEWHFTAPDGRAAKVRVSGNLVSASPDTLRLLAVRGGGIFLAPGFVAAEEIAAGTLVMLLPDFRPVDFAINAFYPHRRHLAAKVRGLLDGLVAHFVAHQQWLDPAAGA
jgi:DNA-binding transcriptional LysR family regulator